MAKGDSEEGTGIRGNSFAAHSALSGVGLGGAKGGRGGVRGWSLSRVRSWTQS